MAEQADPKEDKEIVIQRADGAEYGVLESKFKALGSKKGDYFEGARVLRYFDGTSYKGAATPDEPEPLQPAPVEQPAP